MNVDISLADVRRVRDIEVVVEKREDEPKRSVVRIQKATFFGDSSGLEPMGCTLEMVSIFGDPDQLLDIGKKILTTFSDELPEINQDTADDEAAKDFENLKASREAEPASLQFDFGKDAA